MNGTLVLPYQPGAASLVDGDPTGVYVPSILGQIAVDPATGIVYTASGPTAGEWVSASGGGSQPVTRVSLPIAFDTPNLVLTATASLTTGSGESEVVITAYRAGSAQNGLTVEYVAPVGVVADTTATIDGYAITVALAGTDGVVTALASDVVTALSDFGTFSGIIYVTNGEGTGSEVVEAMAATHLSGGQGGVLLHRMAQGESNLGVASGPYSASYGSISEAWDGDSPKLNVTTKDREPFNMGPFGSFTLESIDSITSGLATPSISDLFNEEIWEAVQDVDLWVYVDNGSGADPGSTQGSGRLRALFVTAP